MNGNETIIGQGSFTQGATAVNQTIMVPQGADWVEVWNYTQANQSTSAAGPNGYRFYWQRGNGSNLMGDGTQGIYDAAGAAGAVTVNVTTSGAFVQYDPSAQGVGSLNNGSTGISALTAANPAVATVGSTAGMAAGSVVRLLNLNGAGQQEFGGIDFSVGYGTFNSTTFSVDYLNATSSTASTSGSFRVIPFNPLFYPRRRVITNITAANPCVITLSVDHGFTVGQKVRLNLVGGSAVWGSFAALSNYDNGPANSTTPDAYTITAVDVAVGNGHNTITLGAVNTTGFGTFRTIWEAIAAAPYTPAEVIPVGEDTSYSIISTSQQTPQVNGLQINGTNTGLLADATVNTGFYGVTLAAGALLPAGVASDVIFWRAGVSTYGGLNSSTPPSE